MTTNIQQTIKESLTRGLDFAELPPHPGLSSNVPHAPKRSLKDLSQEDMKQAVKNALRYFPKAWHNQLAKEFAEELQTYGHIYCYRFRVTEYEIKAYPFDMYPGNSNRARAIMLMIMNNLDPVVAQFPEELITYGGNGSVFSNWAQYRMVMKYLSTMTDEQTLAMYSGHPMGLFPSTKESPVAVVTNGLMIPNYSKMEDYNRGYAMGNTMYGQMTAGSWAYIGGSGIVHGTTITIKNAGRKYLGLEDLKGKVYLSSGLGGMSGAQGKASVISNIAGVICEVFRPALEKRYEQGWIEEIVSDLDQLIERIKEIRKTNEVTSIGFHGNVVDVWERLAEDDELLIDLASDQTSCHIPYTGGYYPAGLTVEESNRMMSEDPAQFKEHVHKSLIRQITAINKMTEKGVKFWDYGNAFLMQCSRAAKILNSSVDIDNKDRKVKRDFIYPSYVEDIMGDVFSLGFGPFRWVCTSGKREDLLITDQIAADVIRKLMKDAPKESQQQFADNLLWITKADENKLVVGSQARILYSDTVGRMEIALAFNEAVRSGRISAPVVLSRDHHDVSGADSWARETSNIKDGSYKTADMATQTVLGNAQRGASWVALHNGGGCGWGEVINCGFGLLMDGSSQCDDNAKNMLFWDVTNGLARRQWAYHPYARQVIQRLMEREQRLQVTLSHEADDDLIDSLFSS